jgi:hypothetical protein
VSGDRVSTLADRIAHLRALALLDPEAGALQVAIVDMLEDLAATVDRLEAEHPRPPDDGEHLGSI